MTPASSSASGKGARFAGLVGLALLALVPLATGCPFSVETFHRSCGSAADCKLGTDCIADTCVGGVCQTAPKPKSTPCPNPKGVCDGAGMCIECLANADCAGNYPMLPICDEKSHLCVSCTDGKKNGQETGTDCGGPDCGACPAEPCDPMHGCGDRSFCDSAENICCNNPCNGVCQVCTTKNGAPANGSCGIAPLGTDPFHQCATTGTATAGGCGAMPNKCACEDGAKNQKETDVDCGGGTCPGCAGGKACVQDTDCASNVANCVKGVCCNATCSLPCTYCNTSGACVIAPAGYSDPFCTAPTVCSPNGCVGTAGAPCTGNTKCLSGSCMGGNCAKSQIGGACSTTNDCATGTCQNYVCM